MSGETITLELLGGRLLALTADVRDLQQRFTGLEARFAGLEVRFDGFVISFDGRISALERRFAVQEERMSRMLALIVRLAERQGVHE
ncbi:MAG: hypothetical protein ACREE2_16325 [Stellaceae bacterium]